MGCNSLSKYLAPGPWQPVPQHSQRRNWKQTKRSASSANAFSLATQEVKKLVLFSFTLLLEICHLLSWHNMRIPFKGKGYIKGNIKNQAFFCSSSFSLPLTALVWNREWLCTSRPRCQFKSWSGHWDRAERQFMSSQFEFEFEKKVNNVDSTLPHKSPIFNII